MGKRRKRHAIQFLKRQILLSDASDRYAAISTEALSPDHSHESVKAQMADGMMHVVSDYAKSKAGDDPGQLQIVMGYYGAAQLPVYDMLARSYAVCDHWFCSHVGPTWPNRFVAMTGDLNRNSWGEPEVNTPDYMTFTPSEATTLFDLLSARGDELEIFSTARKHDARVHKIFIRYGERVGVFRSFAGLPCDGQQRNVAELHVGGSVVRRSARGDQFAAR